MSVTNRENEAKVRRDHAAGLLAAARDEYVLAARDGRGGRATQSRYAAHVDGLVRYLAESAARHTSIPVVICAVGGYGRRTLCLHSDIDLLIVFARALGPGEEKFVSALLQPLWDLRLTVGHHVRELAELDDRADDNPEFELAICDLRLLIGDVALFDDVLRRIHRQEVPRAEALITALLGLARERHAGFNDTLYQLEPDIKNAPGALRDIGAVRLLRSLGRERFLKLGRPEGERLDEAEEFFLRVRSVLHIENSRDMNVLTHEHQERVADVLGMAGAQPQRRVEALMSEYFRHARGVGRALDWSRRVVAPPPPPAAAGPLDNDFEIGADGIAFRDPASASRRPMLWLGLFQAAVVHGAAVSELALSTIRDHVGRYTAEYFLATEDGRRRVRALCSPMPGLSARLSEMLECGLLGTIFPEFVKIHCRVVRDFYHKYTVDEHTLLTIRNLESLWHPTSASRARFGSILNEIHSPDLLTLALLYHDVGKWRDEDHATESVRLAQPMLDRLQLPAEDRETVEFLIKQHLAMSAVVFRRDFGDPETVAAFTQLIGTEERLKMLCLMTLADIEAVAPGTLTPWKEDLLWRLYVDAYNHLTMGYADELIAQDQLGRAVVVAQRPGDISEVEILRFLEGLPRRYLTVFGLPTIYRHVRLARGLSPGALHTAVERHDDVWQLTVAALDKPYLFSNIAGVLSFFGMNIHRGQAMTTPDHLALDVFEFTDDEGFLRKNPEAREEIVGRLRGAVAGTVDVRHLLRGREGSVLHRRRPAIETLINLDNEHSQKYTVVEIVTADRPGLLYRISRAISDQGCDVDLVLISTEGHKAVDVLHVTKHGRKLVDADQRALRSELASALEAPHEAH